MKKLFGWNRQSKKDEMKSVPTSEVQIGADGTASIESEQLDRSNRKKKIVIAICAAICLILIFALSRMQYTTPEMRGKVSYEPALFNTVLLGNLVDADAKAVGDSTGINKPYTMAASGEDESGYQQTVTGKKLTQSLTVSESTELGSRVQESGNYAKVTPGNATGASIPFTVTNGTTLQDDKTNLNKVRNVAASDIRYTLHIISSGNLPLHYELKDVDSNTTYALKEVKKDDDTMGSAKEYTVAGTTTESPASSDGVFYNGARILPCDPDDSSIIVHRYELIATWPSEGKNEQGVLNNDLSYMKELENVEIRVEVESYVNYINATKTGEEKAEGIMVIKANPVIDTSSQDSDSMTTYKPVGLGNVYAQKTVRYDNLTNLTTVPSLVQNQVASGDKVSSYTMHICNGDSVAKSWVADSQDETSKTRVANGHNPKDGHYQYSGTYVSGSYKVVVAVPLKNSGVSSKDRTDMKYYLEYNGELYVGKADETKVTTSKWTKKGNKSEEDTDNNKSEQKSKSYTYEAEETDAYQIMKFYSVNDNSKELTLTDFSNSSFTNKDVKLYVASKAGYIYHSSKDDFRIYIYN